MSVSEEHKQRIIAELEAAGVGNYGKSKFASHYLPNVIRENEHIKAAVYGRYKAEGDSFSITAGMLIATDHRVIFLDHKPGFTSMDEIVYDVVSGVKKTTNGFFSNLTLHTRVGDYTLKFTNSKCTDLFIEYVEVRQMEFKD